MRVAAGDSERDRRRADRRPPRWRSGSARASGARYSFVNTEGPVALLSDASRCRALLGEPEVPLSTLREWVAHWVETGGASLGKPTHFEVADGRF